MNEDYVKYEIEFFHKLEEARKLKEKIICCGKLREARHTGQRYQPLTEEDVAVISESLDDLFNVYGDISRISMDIQQELVYIKSQFKEGLKVKIR